MANIEKLKKFITDNNISFGEGNRNEPSVILAGYALYLGLTDVDIVVRAIEDELGTLFDDDSITEFERVFDYAKKHNYENWWKIDANQLVYNINE